MQDESTCARMATAAVSRGRSQLLGGHEETWVESLLNSHRTHQHARQRNTLALRVVPRKAFFTTFFSIPHGWKGEEE